MPAESFGNQIQTSERFQDLYNSIVAANNGSVPEQGGWRGGAQVQMTQQDNQGANDQSQADTGSQREMSSIERLFAQLNEAGESIVNSTNVKDDEGNDVPVYQNEFRKGNLLGAGLGLVTTLPQQMLGSVPMGAASLYEAATGKPVADADVDANQISDKDLDTTQRLGALGSGLINTAGVAAGGSVKFLEGGANVAKQAIAPGTKLLEGPWSKAVGSVTGSKVGAFAADALEEGAEESADSLFGDLRQNGKLDEGSAGRALEAGAWGAAGGAIMSGAGMAMNKAAQLISDQKTPQETANDPWHESPDPYSYLDNLKGSRGTLVPSVAAANDEEINKQGREVPGSASFTNRPDDADLTIDRTALGSNGIRAIFYNNDRSVDADGKTSAQRVADTFGTDVKTIDEIFQAERRNPAQKASEALNQLIKDKRDRDGNVYVTLGRNPDTSKEAVYEMILDHVFDGDGVKQNSATVPLTGSDVDGDKTQVYFRRYSQASAPSAHLVGSDGKSTTFNLDYLGLDSSEDGVNRAMTQMKKMLREAGVSHSTIATAEGSYREAMARKRGGDKEADIAVMSSLQTLRDSMRSQAGEGIVNERDAAAAINGASNTFAGVLNGMRDSNYITYVAKSYAKDMEERNPGVQELRKAMEATQKDWSGQLKSGDLAGGNTTTDFLMNLGYLVSTVSKSGNPFFRQFGAMYYYAKRVSGITDAKFADKYGEYVTKDVFDQLMATTLGLRNVGESPENAIEGVFRAWVALDVRKNGGIPAGGISTEEDVKNFKRVFAEAHNRYIKTYNDALKQLTVNGEMIPYTAAQKQPIHAESTAEMARAIGDVYASGSYKMGDLFNIPPTSAWRDASIDQAIEDEAMRVGVIKDTLAFNDDVNSFFYELVRDYGGKMNALARRIETTVEDMVPTMANMLSRVKDGKFDAKDAQQATLVLDFIAQVIDPKVAMRMGLGSIDTILDSPYGQEFFSGDAKRVLNAMVSASMYYQFNEERRMLAMYKENPDENGQWLQAAIDSAVQKGHVSPLHDEIIGQLIDKHDMSLLDTVCDLGISYSDKVQAMEQGFEQTGRTVPPLMSMALKTTESEMDVTTAATRFRKGVSQLSRTLQFNYDYQLGAVKNIEMTFKTAAMSEQDKMAALTDIALNAQARMSDEVLGTFCWDQKQNTHEEVEKGTVLVSASLNYQTVQSIFEGGDLAWVAQLTGQAFGVYDAKDVVNNRILLMKAVFDPEADFTVFVDGRKGKCHLNQTEIFKSIGMTVDENHPLQSDQVIALMKAYPQLASWMAPPALQAGMVNGEASLTKAYQKSLDVAVGDWVKSSMDNGRSNVAKARLKVENMLYRDPEFLERICASIDDADGIRTPAAMRRAAVETKDKIVSAYLYAARHVDGGPEWEKLQGEYDKATYKKICYQIKEFVDACAIVNDRFDIESDIKGPLKNAISMQMQDSLYDMQVAYQIDQMKANGQISGDIDLKGLGIELPKTTDVDYGYLQKITQCMYDLEMFLVSTTASQNVSQFQLTPSIEARERIAQKLDAFAAQNPRRKEDADKVKQMAAELRRPSVGMGVASESFFFANEIEEAGLGDLAAVKAKAKHIVDEYAFNQEGYDEKVIDAAFDKKLTPSKAKRLRRDVANYYNNIYVRYILNEMMTGTTEKINPNFYQQQLESASKFYDNVDKIRQAFANEMLPDVGEAYMPVAHWENPSNAAMASAARINAQSGMVGYHVSEDGMQSKICNGIALIGNDLRTAAEPKVVKAWEIKNDLRYWEGVNYDRVDSEGNVEIQPLTASVIRRMDDDADVTVYDPDDNIIGVDDRFAKQDGYRRDKDQTRIGQILMELMNYAAEPRNLKLKKKSGNVDDVIQSTDYQDDIVGNLLDGKVLQQPDAQMQLLNYVKAVRRNMQIYFAKQFNAEDIPLDGYDALTLAQFLTPYVTATYRGADGQLHESSLGMEALLDEGKVGAWIDAMGGAQAVQHVQPEIMSMQQISLKIYDHVVSKLGAADVTARDLNEAAIEAYRDAAAMDERIDAADVLYMTNYINRATTPVIPTADSRTATQRFMGVVEPQMSHIEGLGRDERPFADQKMTDDVRRISAVFFGEVTPYNVFKLVHHGYGKNPVFNIRNDETVKLFQGIPDADKYHWTNGVIVAATEKDVDEAVSLARYHDCYAALPKDAVPRNFEGYVTTYIKDGSVAIVDVHRKNQYDSMLRGQQGSTRFVDPNGIGVNALLGPESKLSDAGHLYNPDFDHGSRLFSAYVDKDLRDLFASPGSVALCDKRDIEQLAEDYADGDRSMISYKGQDQGRFNEMAVDNAIQRYFDSYKTAPTESGPDSNAILSEDQYFGNVVGFAKSNCNGKVMYAPIVLDEVNADYVQRLSASMEGSVLTLTMNSILEENSERAQKWALMGQVPMKSQGAVMSREQAERIVPKLDWQMSGKPMQVKGVWDKLSTENRIFDRSSAISQNNLYWMSRKIGVSIFHKYNQDTGNWEVRDYVRKNIGEGQLLALLNGEWNGAWAKVASRETTLTDDPEINGIIADVTRTAHMAGMNPALFFTSMDFTVKERATADENGVAYPTVWTGAYRPVAQTYQFMTGSMNQDKLLKLYHAIDERLCPNGINDVDDPKYVFTKDCKMYGRMPGSNRVSKIAVIIGDFMLEDNTGQGAPSSSATMSLQHAVNRTGWKGVVGEFADDLMINAMSKVGDYSRQMLVNRDVRPKTLDRTSTTREAWRDTYGKDNNQLSLYSAAELRYRQKIKDEARTFEQNVPIHDAEGSAVDPLGTDMAQALERYRKATGIENLSYKEANNLYKWYTARSYNGGNGVYQGYMNEFLDVARRIETNMKQYGMPISTKNKVTGRHCISLVSEGMAKRLWKDGKQDIRDRFDGDYGKFVKAMNDDMTLEAQSIAKEKSIAERNALERLMDLSSLDHNLPIPDGRVWGEIRVSEIMRTENAVLDAMQNGDSALAHANREIFEQDSERSREWFEHNREVLENHKVKRVALESSRSGWVTRYRGDRYNTITNLMRNAAMVSRTMSMMNPLLTVANVTDRVACQGCLNAALGLGRYKIGPYAGKYIDQDAVLAASKDETVIKIYTSYRMLTFTGDELEFLQNATSVEAIDKFLDERHQAMGNLERFTEMVYKAASGGNFLIDGQIRNAINIFVKRASDAGHDWWFQPTGPNSDETVIETQLKVNPSKFLLGMFAQNDNPDFMLWMQSMNKAKQGDMAQRNLVSALYAAACNRSSAVDFLTTTCVSKFVMYQSNVLGRVLNYVLPVSSLNYLAVDTAAKLAASGKTKEKGFAKMLYDLGIDETLQIQANMREAILVDLCKLGISSMAAILASLTLAFEPPEDDDKKDDYEEWTIFGFRIKVNWWLSDTLGPILPLAVTYRSILEDGRPNMNILFKGLAQCLYSNPAMKVSDVIELLFDPEESFWEGYNMDALDFDGAKGGSPSIADYWGAQGTTWTLSWLSQFVTPSFVKEVYNSMQEYEVSYKRIFEENETGQLTEDGQSGTTEKTTYFDSQLRQISKKNPVIGFVLDMVLHPNTGYMAHEMPRTVYYDPEQLNSFKYFSMYNDDGTEKTDAQKDALALEIISTLDGTDDMASLYREGFVLSSDTRAYVATVIWDAYYSVQSQWNQMTADGDFDFKTLGDGDWSLGQQRYAALKSAYQSELQYYKDLYYDKLYSDELNKGLVKYNRYNTTYSKDASGEWYATGFRRELPLLPVSWAPGETTNADGYQPTMSRENDWATESVVTGNSTGQRALVPYEEGNFSTPSFESWSSDGSGTSYSSNYRGSSSGSSSSYSSSYGSGYGSSGYSYGSRRYSSSSRGSGGSSGGSKTIYSRLPSINPNSARTMNTVKLSDASYDYLRPDFDTKGSREAYKRSDI